MIDDHQRGVTGHPDRPWTREARDLVMVLGESAGRVPVPGPRSRGEFAVFFDAVFTDAGIEAVQPPPRCPRANCFAERFVLTVRTELTNRMLIYGQPHLRRMPALCAVHYNARRPHRALQLRPPRPAGLVAAPVHGPIRRQPVLGGLINEYEPAA